MTAELRSRVWVDGNLVSDERVTAGNVDLLSATQLEACAAADAQDHVWLVEISDPDDELPDLPLRFGTDPGGMVAPVAIDLEDLG
jgi:hypothetical protein